MQLIGEPATIQQYIWTCLLLLVQLRLAGVHVQLNFGLDRIEILPEFQTEQVQVALDRLRGLHVHTCTVHQHMKLHSE